MNKVIVKIERENLLIERTSIVEFEALYSKGELCATLKRLWEEIFDYIEDDYTTVAYNGIGVFLNGTQAHIFDKEWACYMGCGSVPAV